MLTAAERYRGSVYKVDPDNIEEMAFCEDSDRFLMCGDGEMTNRCRSRRCDEAGRC
jgi:3'-phosphoadenosine 5'-phosphosulfate sulfotransferase